MVLVNSVVVDHQLNTPRFAAATAAATTAAECSSSVSLCPLNSEVLCIVSSVYYLVTSDQSVQHLVTSGQYPVDVF